MRSQKSIFGLLSSLERWQHLYHETQQLSEQLVHWYFNAKNTISSKGISREIVTTSHIQRQVQSVVSQPENQLINQNIIEKVVDCKSRRHRRLPNDNSEQSLLQLRR